MIKAVTLIICLVATTAHAQADRELIAKNVAQSSIKSYKMNPANALSAIAKVYPNRAQQLQACLKSFDRGSSDNEVEICMVREIVANSITSR